MTKDTCEQCRFFGKDACSHHVTDPKHERCSEFYRDERTGKKSKEPVVLRKVSGTCDLGPYEAVMNESGTPLFLVRTGVGEYQLTERVLNQGHTFEPKLADEIPYEHYQYYREQLPDRNDIYFKVRDEFGLFLDTDDAHKDLLTACVLMSYQQEKLNTVPYVYLYGDNESGKTVALTLLSWLCYRPMYCVTLPVADIYGYLEDSDSPGTVLEDEAQGFWRDQEKSKIYKAGYKYGARIPRTILLQHGRKIKYYRCFGFKAVASEQLPSVKGVVERFLFIPMMEGVPKKDWADVDKDDFKRLRTLRNLLLKWRLATRLDWQLPEVDFSAKGRLKELWKPVLQIVHGLPIEPKLIEYSLKSQLDRVKEKQATLEAHLVRVVALNYDGAPIPYPTLWDDLVTELNGKLDDKKPNQMDTPEFGLINKVKIGYRMRELFGVKSEPVKREGRVEKCYTIPKESVRKLAKKYSIQFDNLLTIGNQVTKVTTLESTQTNSAEKTMEINRENNVVSTTPEASNSQETGKPGNLVTDVPGTEKNVSSPAASLEWLRSEFQKGNNPILALEPLDPVEKGKCPLCGHLSVNLCWQLQLIDGSRFDSICLDCGGHIQDLVREFEGKT